MPLYSRFTRILYSLVPCLIALQLIAVPAFSQHPDTLERSLSAPVVTPQTGARLGMSVAVDGDFVVVGAPLDDLRGQNFGSVKVFHRESGALHCVIPNPRPGWLDDEFGTSVAISGTRVVVGAPRQDGFAYVFDLAGPNPTEPVFTIRTPNPPVAEQNDFGISVAISGTRVAVRAHTSHGIDEDGAIYVYELSNATPTVPIAVLTNPNGPANEWFGSSLAVLGNRVVVGAPMVQVEDQPNAGCVYLFTITDSVAMRRIDNPSPARTDKFGLSVAIDGNLLVVGSPLDDGFRGEAHVFNLETEAHIAALRNPSNAYIASRVAIAGTRVLVSSVSETVGNSPVAGAVYVFDVATGDARPDPIVLIQNPSPALDDNFGISVAISGSHAVIGAPLDDTLATDAGSAYGYDLNSPSLANPVVFNHAGQAGYVRFGTSMAMSGSRLVVGVPTHNVVYIYDQDGIFPSLPIATIHHPHPIPHDQFGRAVAIDGTKVVVSTGLSDRAGRAYVFDLNSEDLSMPTHTLTNPTSSIGDNFGSSVGISGNRVIIGAPNDDTDGMDAGAVQLYDLLSENPASPVRTLRKDFPAIEGNRYGSSVAISGDHFALTSGSGSMYVYRWDSNQQGQPSLVHLMTHFHDDGSGASVAMEGTRVVVGVPRSVIQEPANVGRAFVYDMSNEVRANPIAILRHPTPANGQRFGASIAMSGSHVIVGCPNDDHGSQEYPIPGAGSAFVFDLASDSPVVPVAALKRSDPANFDSFGSAVAIGRVIAAVGIPGAEAPTYDRGMVQVFAPQSAAPTAILNPPQFVGASRAALSGTIDSHWSLTNYRFEYRVAGTSDARIVAAPGTIPRGGVPVEIGPLFYLSMQLVPETTYDLWLVAENAVGSTTSGPITFTTLSDTNAPSIRPASEYSPTTLVAGSGGSASLPDYLLQSEALDDVAVVSLTQDPIAGTALPLGPHQVTVRAADAAENVGTVTFTVTVRPQLTAPATTLLFTKGGSVPGAGVLGSRIPEGAVWTTFGPPAINDTSAMAFLGRWKAGPQSGMGIFVTPSYSANAQLRAIQGEFIEGVGRLSGFRDPQFASDGSLLFLANLKDGAGQPSSATVVCWMGTDDASPRLVARTGVRINGQGSAVLRSIGSAALASGGHVALRGTVGSERILLTWSKESGTLTPVIRDGMELEGFGTVKSFHSLVESNAAPGADRGWFLVDDTGTPHLHVRAKFANGVSRILSFTGETINLFALAGPLPSEGYFDDLRSIDLPSFSKRGAIRAAFETVASNGFRGVVHLQRTDGSMEWVMGLGSSNGPSNRMIFNLQDVLCDPDGTGSLTCANTGPRRTSTGRTLIWNHGTEQPTVIAEESLPTDGFRLDPYWKRISSFALPGGSTGPVFTAFIAGNDVGAAENFGLWGMDGQGHLRAFLQEGDVVENKTIRSFKVFRAIPSAAGVGRSYNRQGQLAVLAVHPDHSTSILRVDVPWQESENP